MSKVTSKSSSPSGYFEKNFAKLMSFRHKDYMYSRIFEALAGVVLTAYFFCDALFFHGSDGGLIDYIYVVAVIFFITVLRKTILRLLEAADKSKVVSFVEPSHNPEESWWVRFGFWLPFGRRRGLNGFISRTSELFFILLMIFALLAKCVKSGIVTLPSFVPIFFSEVTFPVESWIALSIAEVALVISWVNNSLFLMKYASVRKTIGETIKGLPNVQRLSMYLPLQIFKLLNSGISEGGERPCDENTANDLAHQILSQYSDAVLTKDQKSALHSDLVRIICEENSPVAIMEFLVSRIVALEGKSK